MLFYIRLLKLFQKCRRVSQCECVCVDECEKFVWFRCLSPWIVSGIYIFLSLISARPDLFRIYESRPLFIFLLARSSVGYRFYTIALIGISVSLSVYFLFLCLVSNTNLLNIFYDYYHNLLKTSDSLIGIGIISVEIEVESGAIIMKRSIVAASKSRFKSQVLKYSNQRDSIICLA